MTKLTEAERRYNMEQALANTRLAGHEPTKEFLDDCEAVIKGEITNEEARLRIIDRALRKIDEDNLQDG